MILMKNYSIVTLILRDSSSKLQMNRVKDGNSFHLLMMNLTIYKIPTIQERFLSIVNRLFIIWEEILQFLSLMFGIRILTVGLKMQMLIAKKLQKDNQNWIDFENSKLE